MGEGGGVLFVINTRDLQIFFLYLLRKYWTFTYANVVGMLSGVLFVFFSKVLRSPILSPQF